MGLRNKSIATAVVAALAGGASLSVAYYYAAQQHGITPQEAVAETQTRIMETSMVMRELGRPEPEIRATIVAANPGAPEDKIRGHLLLTEGAVRDPRTYYRHDIALVVSYAEEQAALARIVAARCEPLETLYPQGGTQHPAHVACVNDVQTMLAVPYCSGGQAVGKGAMWRVTDLQLESYVAAFNGSPVALVTQATPASVAAAVAARGWTACE